MNTDQLKEALLTIGRSLPVGMEVHFYREEGDSRARMQISMPDGSVTDYAFLNGRPLPAFPLVTLLRETHLETALRDLIASIELFTDLETNQINRDFLEENIKAGTALVGDPLDWEPDTSHPANKTSFVPAQVSYPTGSMGEAVEVPA